MAGGRTIRLTSGKDGFEFAAYHVAPDDARHGGLVLIQEIFGVTEHIPNWPTATRPAAMK